MLYLVSIVALLTLINEQEAWQYKAIFYGCILAPLWEEMAFRVLPVMVARQFSDKLIIPVLGISAFLFGWGHGQGPNSLLIQGVGGILLSVVYVKTNYSYWSVVGMHALWNFWLYFLT
jgi:CAAX amino terminal protease family.